jgi:hypothetical protein
VYALLPRLLERAGAVAQGSITGFYSVLAEGDDPNDPVVDAARSVLDGHVWLSRERANRGQFPAIDVLASVSRLSRDVMDSAHAAAAERVRALLAAHHGARDLLSVGLYDVKGLDRFHFAIADDELREAVFNETSFDHALFPAGPQAQLTMEWEESEPASFTVEVPRHLVVEPPGGTVEGRPRYDYVAETLHASVSELRAAGVRADVQLVPFTEQQPQRVSFRLSTKILDPERGPAGEGDRVALGGRFGESALGGSRFE